MKKTLLALLLALLCAPPATATESLTLAEALATAKKNHPQIEEAAANLTASDARLGQAMANYWPQISLAADWTKGDTYLTTLGAIRETEISSTAVVVRQNIYDFGRTAGTTAAARGVKAAAAENLAASRQDVTFRLKTAWYLLFAAEQQVEASRKTMAARAALARQATEFFKHGTRSKVEAARAEATLFAGKSLLIRAENNRDLAKLELANAMGVMSLDDRPLLETETVSGPLPENLATLRDEALNSRSEMKRLIALQDAASGSLRSAKSGYLPTLSGMASYGDAGQSMLPEGKVWALGVNLSLPVFSGFATQNQVREADALIQGVEAQQKSLRMQIGKEVESAWLAIKEARARFEENAKETAAAQESQRLSMERYKEGLGTMVEAIDAQAQAMNAETARIQAGYDEKIALARLDRAVGKE